MLCIYISAGVAIVEWYEHYCRDEDNPTYADKNFLSDFFAFQPIS